MRSNSADIPSAQDAVFDITFRPQRGVDGIRALRHLLKYALRACGLVTVGCIERNELATAARRRRPHGRERAGKRSNPMDVRKFLGKSFLKPEHVKDGPIELTIVEAVESDRYDKVELVFDDGTCLSLGQINLRTLIRAYGDNTDDWLGRKVEASWAEVDYQNEKQAMVLLKPISPAIDKPAPKVKPKPKGKLGDDLDDVISF